MSELGYHFVTDKLKGTKYILLNYGISVLGSDMDFQKSFK